MNKPECAATPCAERGTPLRWSDPALTRNAAGMTRRAALLGALAVATPAALAAPQAARALSRPALAVARPTQANLQVITRAGDSRRLVAAGERGLILCSEDDGQSWTQARVPVSVTLTALRFADARRGWAVGNMGVVLATEDGGASWRKCLDGQAAAQLALQAAQEQLQVGTNAEAAAQASVLLEDAQRLVGEGPDKPLLDIALRADGSLLAVGAYGLSFASRDGGQSWQSQMHRLPNPEGLSYYGLVDRRGESLLYGEQGLLLHSAGTDGRFTPEESPDHGSLFGGLALRDGTVLLLGLRGRVWRSVESRQPWQAVQTPVDAALIAGTQMNDGRVLLVGAAGQALLSRDGGESFRPLGLRQRFPYTGVAQAHDGSLLLVGVRGLLRLGTDELRAAPASTQARPGA